jgi:parallel beta-helix repeat protein
VNNCPVGIISRTVAGPNQEPETARQERAPYSFTITGNTVSNCSDAGIRIRSGEDGVVATNTVRNNGTNMDIVEEFTSGLEEGMNATR